MRHLKHLEKSGLLRGGRMILYLMIEEHELDKKGITEKAQGVLNEIKSKVQNDYPEIVEYHIIEDD